MTLILNRTEVGQVLSMDKAIEVLESAFCELSHKTADMPPRTVIIDNENNGWLGYMPAYLRSNGQLGIKAVSVYKNNVNDFSLPTTIGTILVQDRQTGEVVSIMDGGLLTGIRTGASAGVATKYLARKNSKVGGIIGTGVMARNQIIAMNSSSNVETILVYSKNNVDQRDKFVSEFNELLNKEVIVASSTEELVKNSDIVTLITSSVEPVVNYKWWKDGVHINAIGSHAVGVRELDSNTVINSKLVCDDIDACLKEAGDIQIPIEEGKFSPEKIYGDIGSIISGKLIGREDDKEITLFKSVGLAIQDISCASFVYEMAKKNNLGTEVSLSD
ncbi:MAG: ornithine cyclodeaminase family protein [Chloroflexi bacterium]|nr:ornithine cyclodeaminase family protein [Chloroflexota bacterium]